MGEQLTFYCPRCWKEIPAAAGVCPHCHVSIESSAKEAFLDKLVSALRRPVPSKAAFAAQILGRLRDPRAVPPLLETLVGTCDTEIREAAIGALTELGDARAVDALAHILDDSNSLLTMRVAVAHALGRIGDARATAALRAAAGDGHAPARAARAALDKAQLAAR
ncbi:MAG: HEAT repeat domain-containing protein [Chloroflexi bacterium]|nr:HEAT repeat domain-containing protein [Chloroflexota bacterium]